MPAISPTYRNQFSDEESVRRYDADQYGSSSYSSLMWEFEKLQLDAVLRKMRSTHAEIDYLDFASGSGRIIGYLEDKVDTATGIEISQAMVDVAAARVTRANFICGDITRDDEPVENTYDLITAYRFMLNAEPDLRQQAIHALARRLRDKDSVLVFNNHGNLPSHKLVLWPIHRAMAIGGGHRTSHNYMTNKQAERLASSAGLQIVETMGCGFIGRRLAGRLPAAGIGRLEGAAARSTLLQPFCVNQTYIVKLRP